jgi:hypothetical protein
MTPAAQRTPSAYVQRRSGRNGAVKAFVRTWGPRVLILALASFVIVQLIPYGRDHGAPDVELDPVSWATPEAEQAFTNACADCHSYDTEWPWYSNVAPISWLVQRDVDEGRDAWNVSTGDAADEADDAVELIESGDMPPSQYLPMHPDARLSDEEQAALIAALEQMDEGDAEDRADDAADEAEDRADDAADEAEDRADDAEDEAEDRQDDAEDRSGSNSGPG